VEGHIYGKGGVLSSLNQRLFTIRRLSNRVELLPGFKFTGKMVKIMEFTGKIGKAGKW
jgi:hypothetical protein